MSTATLWTLPAQPLPKSDVRSSAIVTIWAFVTATFAIMLHVRLRNSGGKVWTEFKIIRTSAILLAVWYLATFIDRWIHYERRAVRFGYILFEPITQALQLLSTIFFLWGTYGVVWNELQRRFASELVQGAWWLAAKITLFVVGVVTCFFWVLRVATAAVWLEFFSMNVISDVATKRNGFEMAMTFFFSLFALLIVVEVVATVFFRAKKEEGSWAKTRIYVVLASVVLLARCMAECAIAFTIHMSVEKRRADMQPSCDIAYGLLTSLYLLLIFLQACQLSSKLDMGSSDVSSIEGQIRTYIRKELWEATQHRAVRAPPLEDILNKTQQDLTAILASTRLSSDSKIGDDEKRKIGQRFIQKTNKEFGQLGKAIHPDPESQQQHAAFNGGGSSSTSPSPDLRRQRRNGRHSAPLAGQRASDEDIFDRLANPSLRSPNSAPNMRHHQGFQRFASPSARDGPPSASVGGFGQPYSSNMPAVREEYPDPPPPAPRSRAPSRNFEPSAVNAPSLGARPLATSQAQLLTGAAGSGSSSPYSPYGDPRDFSPPIPSSSSTPGTGYTSQYDDASDPGPASAQYPFPLSARKPSNSRYGAAAAELHSSPAIQPRRIGQEPILPSAGTEVSQESPAPQPSSRRNFAPAPSSGTSPAGWVEPAGSYQETAQLGSFRAVPPAVNSSSRASMRSQTAASREGRADLTTIQTQQPQQTTSHGLAHLTHPGIIQLKPLTYPPVLVPGTDGAGRAIERRKFVPQSAYAQELQTQAGYRAYQPPRQQQQQQQQQQQGGYLAPITSSQVNPAPAPAGVHGRTEQSYEMRDLDGGGGDPVIEPGQLAQD